MGRKSKILVATDYSETAMNAVLYSVRLAQNMNSDISIIHVYKIPLSSTPIKPLEFAKTRDDYHRSELTILENYSHALFHSWNITDKEVKFECIVHEGSVGKQICKEANEWNADLIVMGTHGASGFQKALFGTHTWEVIDKSSIPVLAIPKNQMFNGIKNIIFAVEQRENELPAINFLESLARKFDANITLLHVTNYSLSKSFEVEMFKKFRKEVMNRIMYKKVNTRLMYSKDVAKGINDYCIKAHANLLVMSPENFSMWKKIFLPGFSITKEMSLYSPVPLLYIPINYHPKHFKIRELFEMEKHMTKEF